MPVLRGATTATETHQCPPPPAGGGYRDGKRTNAHRPRAPRKQSLRGWNLGGGGIVLCTTGGGEITSNQLRVTSYKLPVTSN